MKLPCNCNPPIHSYHDNLAKPMNTNSWETDWNKIFHSVEGVRHFHPEIEDEIKLFISKQFEKLIEDIPDVLENGIQKELLELKDQLRKKYL